MVALNSYASLASDTASALRMLSEKLAVATEKPSFIYVFYDEMHDDALISDFLKANFPNVPVLGGTSCGGTMTQAGLTGTGSIGLLLISDPDGDYGVGAVQLGDDPAAGAERALHAALNDAGCPGELPELIWIYQAPGQEEQVIAGLRRVVGDRCPIIGGSSADNEVAGRWRQLSTDGVMSNGLVVATLFSSGGIGFAFQGGYEPAGASGVVTKVAYSTDGGQGMVTKASGRRIVSIDGEPAAQVYNRWTGGIISDKLSGGSILLETSMHPLGVDAGKIGDVTHYLVIHPEQVLEDGMISTFADIDEGMYLYSMRGDKARLVDRAGKVAAAAAASVPGGTENLAGGLIVYCAGCRIAVADQMEKVSSAVSDSFNGQPYIGCFTFGEQGKVLDRNAHGNLMISAIAFGR